MPDPRLVDFVAGRFGKNDGTAVNLANILDKIVSNQSDILANDSDKILTVPAGKWWDIQSVRVELVTIGTTSDGELGSTLPRQLEVQFRSTADNIMLGVIPGLTQAKNSTHHYNFSPDVANLTSPVDGTFVSTPMSRISLTAGWDIRVFDNKVLEATADDLSIFLCVLENDAGTTAST